MDKFKYEIRQIDAWNSEEGWTWNESYHIGDFKTGSENHKRAFLNALKRLGISCKRGKCKVVFDGDIYELQDRKTGEPLFAALPAA